MNSLTPLKRKTTQSLVASILIFSMLAGVLSSCNLITKTPSPTGELNYELTPTVMDPATQELTLVSPTEVATEMPTLTLTPEPTATATEMPTPTKEKSLIEGNIFFDPQSEADFPMVVESPSPIDNPEEFAVWQNEYLRLIDEKLETYEGVTMDVGIVGISYNLSALSFDSREWPVIAAYKFYWQEQEILTKTYLFNDGSGHLLPLSLTSTTPDSVLFDTEMQYKTPLNSKLWSLGAYFEWKANAKNLINDEFVDDFLPDEKENTNFDLMRRVTAGMGTDEDLEAFGRIPFVGVRFNQVFN